MRAESGPIGGDMSHEFVILADTGESEVFCDKALLDLPIPGEDTDFNADLSPTVDAWTAHYAATDDMHDAAAFEALPADRRIAARGIELGHIFYFGTKYSDTMNAQVTGPDGVLAPVHMGSYGIGPSRVVAAIIEASHDDGGIIWPDAVTPFDVGLVNLKPGDGATDKAAEALLSQLEAAGLSVLYDDTDNRAGAKFATMDLIGLPWQVVVGPRSVADGQAETKRRASGERQTLSYDAVLSRLAPSKA